MKFEKLDDNKIRIILNINELKDKNIDYQGLMSNSIDTQKLFCDMLDEAEEKIGFKTKDYKVMIEALATMNGNFIVTVTRSIPDIETNLKKKKFIQAKRKTEKFTTNCSIFSFKSFEDFFDFCSFINSKSTVNINKISKDFSLFTYKDMYYLIINTFNLNKEDLNIVNFTISEFGYSVPNPDTFKNLLLEYGTAIMKKNAIARTIKYFN